MREQRINVGVAAHREDIDSGARAGAFRGGHDIVCDGVILQVDLTVGTDSAAGFRGAVSADR